MKSSRISSPIGEPYKNRPDGVDHRNFMSDSEDMKLEPGRPYRMVARAEKVSRTGEAIIAASLALYHEMWLDEITLEKVAARAGVSTKTLVRRYGSRDGLVAAVAQTLAGRVAEQRFQAPVGDLPGAVANLTTHYEHHGDLALRNMVQAQRFPHIAALVEHGRAEHRQWVGHAFAPWLTGRPGPGREILEAQLIAITDVTVWQVLRRDLGLDERRTRTAVEGLLHALLPTQSEDEPR
jgi:AcrR family transcriptional regulator